MPNDGPWRHPPWNEPELEEPPSAQSDSDENAARDEERRALAGARRARVPEEENIHQAVTLRLKRQGIEAEAEEPPDEAPPPPKHR